MGIDQDGANAASQQCKTNKKKKKKNLIVSTSSCKCSDTLEVLHVNGEKCSTAWCSNPHEIKRREALEECEEAPSKSRKSSKLKKTKANADLNSSQNSDLKRKERSDQSVKKDCTKLGLKTNELDVTDLHLDKEVEIAKKEGISKKRKKRNKTRKTANIEVSEDCTLVDIGEKTQQDPRNDKKSKKISINQSECAEENEKYEDVTKRSADEKFCDNQTNSDYKRLSKSKRRRNRKKRILAALGLTGSSQSKTSKTRRRKSNASAACKESAEESSCYIQDVDNSCPSDTVGVKNQDKPFSQNLEKICRSVDIVSSASERKPLNTPEQVEEKSIEKKLSDGRDRDKIEVLLPLCNFKDDHSSLNNSLCCDAALGVKAGNSNVLKESAKDIDKIRVETKLLPTGSVKQGIEVPSTLSSRKEETFTDKVNIPNFLSHDNVEGLFRSALLNDITLSSRCSEKEVKNFFNTYGTFSEKNRSQFAEVEKLLLSSNKIEESGESPLFESEKSVSVASQEKAPFDYRSSCLAASNSEISDSDKFSCSSIDTGGKPDCEGHNSNNTFLNSSCSSGSSLNTTDNVCLNKGSGWGPIYTSPNPENRVINSVNSPQIQRENKTALPPLSSSFNSSLSRPEKSESRLLEIVENVLLVHERVREQLTSEKKLSSQRYCPNLSGTGLFNNSETKEFQEKDLQPARSKNTCVNSVLKNNKSDFESAEDDLQGQLFKLDHSTNASVVRPLHECLASRLCPEDLVQENSIKHDKTDSDISKMQRSEKTKEEIKAEREAKKMAKMARKMKGASPQEPSTTNCASGGDTKIANKKNDPIKAESKIENKKNDPVKAQSMSNEPCIVPPSPAVRDEKVPKNEKRDASAKHQLASGATDTAKGDVVDGEISKSKAELRAERRAKQEAQRAAKAQQQLVQQGVKPGKSSVQTEKNAVISAEPAVKSVSVKLTKSSDIGKEIIKPVVMHKVKLFNHLYVKQEASVPKSISATSHLHPAIIRLGVQYATKVVVGSNARCLGLLSAVKQVIEDFKTPPQQEFSRGLEAILQPSMAFLQECRPLSVSMTNAVKHLKWQMRHLPNNISDIDAKRKLQEAIDTYIREQLEVAGQAICNTVIRYISDGNVILTYGCSSLLQRILIKAHKSGTKFRVIVVDARPWREGKEMLRRLVENGLHCSYVLITAASFMMREATKVFLGAHALLANGYVMSRAGSSQVALLARSYNVPVLVCCETHKFSERVQTDSIVYNELGAPDELVTADSCSRDHPLSKWKAINSLTPLNITYDVTPPDMVTAVITELAVLPCTSVPVILRVKPTC